MSIVDFKFKDKTPKRLEMDIAQSIYEKGVSHEIAFLQAGIDMGFTELVPRLIEQKQTEHDYNNYTQVKDEQENTRSI